MLKRDILKNLSISILTLLCLTGLLLFIFRDNMADISAAIEKLSFLNILCLIILGSVYDLLDGLAYLLLIKNVMPAFRYRQALEVTYLGVFGKVSSFAAGAFPMQAYYLHRCGIELGHSAGIKALNYVIHKTSIVLYASVMLLAGGQWICIAAPDITGYLLSGYAICVAVIVILILLCTWKRAYMFALWLLRKLPDYGKWQRFAQKTQKQLEYMYMETTACLQNKKRLLAVILINLIKLGAYCAVPYVCMHMLGENMLGLLQIEMLTAIMFLIAGAIPNVAGMGPIEAVFFLMYKPILGNALTSSALILFRVATYYSPFVISVFVFLIVQRRMLSQNRNKEQRASDNLGRNKEDS